MSEDRYQDMPQAAKVETKENRGSEWEQLQSAYHEPTMSQEQLEEMKHRIEEAKMENRREQKRKNSVVKFSVAAAAVIAAFVILPNTSANVAYAMENIPVIGKLVEVVTFRNYQYEDERHEANVEVPELMPGTIIEEVEPETFEAIKKTTEEINAEIQAITEKIITEFEENTLNQEGYQDILVKSEVINTTEDYFTLKLICYQGAGSGAEWDYFYTIDLNTGERLTLKDIFVENADYITPISENIKEQMIAQMAEDDMKAYWINSEVPEWDFQAITDETSFYLNENGNVVISFNEGDVAPMYMGVVEFEIPAEVLQDIRK